MNELVVFIFYPVCFVVKCQMSIKSNNIGKFYNEDILKEPVNVLLFSKITKQFEDDKLFLAENENNRKLNKKFYNPD